jgi:hypothetical protein
MYREFHAGMLKTKHPEVDAPQGDAVKSDKSDSQPCRNKDEGLRALERFINEGPSGE